MWLSLTHCTTYYFGVSLLDDPSQDEDLIGPTMMGEPDTMMFHPIRDLNADIEKLLEHLPSKILHSLAKRTSRQ